MRVDHEPCPRVLLSARNSAPRFERPPLPQPKRREVLGAASFRIVPRMQKPAFDVGAHSRLVRTSGQVRDGVVSRNHSLSRHGAPHPALCECGGEPREVAQAAERDI